MKIRSKGILSFAKAFFSFSILWVVFFAGLCFAEPGIKITQPVEGSVVNPGQEITVTVEAVEGFIIGQGIAYVAGSPEGHAITTLPMSFTDKIPDKAIGEAYILVIVADTSGNPARASIALKVEQTASLVSLNVTPPRFIIDVDWNNNVTKNSYYPYINVYGVYSDGIRRHLSKDPNTTYASSNPSVVSVDDKGKINVHMTGDAAIVVSNSGVSAEIPIIFQQPSGSRPKETISPTTQIDIQPAANAAGWYNQDISITLTAQDNEGGSGIHNIIYRFPKFQPRYEYVSSDTATTHLSEEGEFDFWYYSVDKELNGDTIHQLQIKLDKTPPQTTAVISPAPDESGWVRSLPVKVSFTAADNLSGVASTTPEQTFTEPGTYEVEYHSEDIAGNIEETKTLTVNISVEDNVPPVISLELVPIKLNLSIWERIKCLFGRFYKLVYSATDEGSGVKEIKAGLVTPDIADFTVKFVKGNIQYILIDEKRKSVIISGDDAQEILGQLKTGLLLIQNNRPLHLIKVPRSRIWAITRTEKFLQVTTPQITFKAEAVDNAGNSATQQIEY